MRSQAKKTFRPIKQVGGGVGQDDIDDGAARGDQWESSAATQAVPLRWARVHRLSKKSDPDILHGQVSG